MFQSNQQTNHSQATQTRYIAHQLREEMVVLKGLCVRGFVCERVYIRGCIRGEFVGELGCV